MKAGRVFLAGLRRGFLRILLILPLEVLALGNTPPAVAQVAPATRPSSGSIRTPDFDETLRWYQDKLGFRLVTEQSFVAGRRAVLERSGFLLEVSEADHVLPEAQDPGITSTARIPRFPVISVLVPDVDAEIARLQKQGVDILQAPEDELEGRYRTAQIRDNGNHRIELREPIDQTGFAAMGR